MFGYTCNPYLPNQKDRQLLSKHFSTPASSSYFCDPRRLSRKVHFASGHGEDRHHKTQEG
ncbi:hypothetical protein AMTRI_Chr05g57390 [Amborella trichopoda]